MSQIFLKKQNQFYLVSFRYLPATCSRIKAPYINVANKNIYVHSKGIISSSKISLAKGQKAKKQMFIIVRKNDLFHGLAIES